MSRVTTNSATTWTSHKTEQRKMNFYEKYEDSKTTPFFPSWQYWVKKQTFSGVSQQQRQTWEDGWGQDVLIAVPLPLSNAGQHRFVYRQTHLMSHLVFRRVWDIKWVHPHIRRILFRKNNKTFSSPIRNIYEFYISQFSENYYTLLAIFRPKIVQ